MEDDMTEKIIFFDYAQRRSIDIIDVTKKHKKSKASYERKKKEPSTFFNYALRRPVDIVDATKNRGKKK